jgi:hypothetical protein
MTQPTSQQPSEPDDPGEPAKEIVSTALDLLGILALAIGSAWGLFSVVGPYAVAIGGVIVIGLNTIAGLSRRPRPEPVEPISPPVPSPPPGPADPGNLHVSGR